ncbi:hypothetical protein HELRODRAFT_169368 [Helobdella robusta]|uniref:Uncharacterized protein n=1 Tax=Helobdella robusta TaxID=6412 RepID=T1F1V0_HELRO|nr:hypothetical protein HELRODRAFT_169368 [Helobdella robusta]ESO08509.1 hypothetical protein HELRODRAFT_169368 [Helobdella robusta]
MLALSLKSFKSATGYNVQFSFSLVGRRGLLFLVAHRIRHLQNYNVIVNVILNNVCHFLHQYVGFTNEISRQTNSRTNYDIESETVGTSGTRIENEDVEPAG